MRRVLLLPLLLAVPARGGDAEVDGLRALETVKVLSSDEFKGRKSGLPSGARAEAWMAERVQELGLRKPNGVTLFDDFKASVTEEGPGPRFEVVGGSRGTRNGAFLVWIGLPITRDEAQTRRFDAINAIVESEAAKRPRRVSYLDTYFSFAGADGGFAQYVSDPSGKLVKMRADDGVHFERAAGDLIARQMLRRLGEHFDLTSWRKR